MGANLIGIHLFIPVDMAKCIFTDHTKRLKQVIESEDSYEKKVASLSDLGVHVHGYSLDDDAFPSGDEAVDTVLSVREALHWLESKGHSPYARDTSATILYVNGCGVAAFFAGATSWGDDPEVGFCDVREVIPVLTTATVWVDL